MDESSSPGARIVVGPATAPAFLPPAPRREYRAMWAFGITAVFGLVVLFIGGGRFAALLSGPVFLLGPILSLIVYAAAAAGLSSLAPWARYAMAPLLAILLVTGVVTMILALLHSTILFPIGAILAWWARRAEPAAVLGPVPARSGFGGMLVVGAVISSVITLLAGV